MKARQDLKDMAIRKELHLMQRCDGSYIIPPPCYTLTKNEKQILCEFFKSVKFSDRYASNISQCVKINEGKVTSLKTHDGHVLLQRILPLSMLVALGFLRCLSSAFSLLLKPTIFLMLEAQSILWARASHVHISYRPNYLNTVLF